MFILVPTFVGFLKDVESPYEVTDYVRSYLGDSKAAKDFTKQFIEKRSRWKQMMKESKTSGRKPKMSEQQNLSLSPSNVDKKSTEFTVVKVCTYLKLGFQLVILTRYFARSVSKPQTKMDKSQVKQI